MPVLVLAAAAAMTVVAIMRLEALAPKLPGVWDAEQLLPAGQDAFYDLDFRQGSGPLEAAAREAQLRREVRALVEQPSATDVAVAGWRQDTDDLVAVAVVEVDDPEATAAALDGQVGTGGTLQVTRAWSEGDRYVVVVGVAASPAEDASTVADEVSGQVETSVLLARVTWFVAVAVIPAVALWVVVATAVMVGAIVQLVVMIAWLLIRLAVFLLIQLPLAVLSRGRFGTTKPPRLARPQLELPPSLAPHVRLVDVDEIPAADRTKSLTAAARALLLMGIAIPALNPAWWPDSLVWAAATGAWFGLGPLARRWRPLRLVRLGLVVLAVLALAGDLLGIGLGNPASHPVVGVAVVVLAAGVSIASVRDTVSTTGTPTYASSYSDLGIRSMVYLVGAVGISFAATCLFLGSNGDRDAGSHAMSKAVGAAGLLAVPITVRRFRAAQAATRRDNARERGVGEVLYLRSFLDDQLRVRSRMRDRIGLERFVPLSREPFEDVVVRAFEARGPVVAITRPGTGEGEFGAARDRIIAEDWLTAVKAEMAESVYVVAVLGPTEGLRIELETLSSLNLLPRVCLLVPPVAPEDAAARVARGTAATNGPGGWGTLDADRVADRQVLALAGVGALRLLFVWRDRNSVRAYLRLGEWLAKPPDGDVGADR